MFQDHGVAQQKTLSASGPDYVAFPTFGAAPAAKFSHSGLALLRWEQSAKCRLFEARALFEACAVNAIASALDGNDALDWQAGIALLIIAIVSSARSIYL